MGTVRSRGDGHGVSASVWFDPDSPAEVFVSLSEPELVHPVPGEDGILITVSANPRSADFDPKTFNTLRRMLARVDQPTPWLEADESIPRPFEGRFRVIGGTAPPPPRDPGRPNDDPWDSDAVRYILSRLEPDLPEEWTPNLLADHMRGKAGLDATRVEQARAMAAQCGVECRPDPDDPTGGVHFFRSDPGAPTSPATAQERRWLQRRK